MNEFKKKAIELMKKYINSQAKEELNEEKGLELLEEGSKAQILIEYYKGREAVDITPYVTIKKIDGDWAYIEGTDGHDDVIELWLLEPDMVTSARKKDSDNDETKEVKRYINLMHNDLESDNKARVERTRNEIRDALYDDDEVRVKNEILIRRAHDKYLEFSMKKINREFQEGKISYVEFCNQNDKVRNVAELVMEDIFDYGIMIEYENIREYEKEREEEVKNENKASSESFDEMFNESFELFEKMMNDVFGGGSHKLSAKQIDEMLGLETEASKKENEEKHIDGLTEKTGLIPFQKIIDARKKKDLPDCLIDMTELAAKGKYEDIIGREEEIATVAETLARKEIRNPLLVGKPGAGKTAVVQELVKRSLRGEIPHLKDKYFYELRMNDLVAGTMYRGQLEEKLQDVMKVLEDDPNVVLFIDEIHMIVQAGATVGDKNDVANALKPYLTSDISIIGATTFDEYSSTLKDDGALARRFNTIMIEEKSKDEVVEILKTVKKRFEDFHHVELSPECVERIVDKVSDSKIDNSLIAGGLGAIDTICTKMKIHEIDENEAYDRWDNEVILSMDRKNNGGRTTGFGFAKQKPVSETEAAKVDAKEEVKAESKVIYLDDKMKDAKLLEQKEDTIIPGISDEDLEDAMDEMSLEDFLALFDDKEEEDDENLEQ
ncbi:MAG: AAA family ATPase [Clostridia bacterium]|nr:AAA family ATPase [Clostridia bacterium]